jgi:Bacterial protein of unknown function (DUF839)
MNYPSLASLMALAFTTPVLAADFGVERDARLADQSQAYFGIAKPLASSAEKSAMEGARAANDVLMLADGLKAEFITRNVAHHADMIAFYPAENPSHMIVCIESDREEIVAGKLNPGLQRVSMADGSVETILRGTNSCDGIRTTPWNTVLFTEEDDAGGAYEILNPLVAKDIVITDRKAGTVSDPAMVVRHMDLPTMAWEGLTILPSGVVFAGDELRPGTTYPDKDGGAIFKFVPATPHAGGALTSLDASPFKAGKTYAMQVSCTEKVQTGQGCDTGAATWVEVKAGSARIAADMAGATGYYRPEDLHQDMTFKGEGVKFCWTNTGNKAVANFGEVMCAVDALADSVEKGKQQVLVSRFLQGTPDLNQPDNLEINPKNGLVYVIEDNPNGDVWSCLPDGADADMMTDGCIKILSVKDSSAEPTGFIFAPDGETAYLNIQHSDDKDVAKVDDYGTDDLIKVTGFGKVDLAAQ